MRRMRRALRGGCMMLLCGIMGTMCACAGVAHTTHDDDDAITDAQPVRQGDGSGELDLGSLGSHLSEFEKMFQEMNSSDAESTPEPPVLQPATPPPAVSIATTDDAQDVETPAIASYGDGPEPEIDLSMPPGFVPQGAEKTSTTAADTDAAPAKTPGGPDAGDADTTWAGIVASLWEIVQSGESQRFPPSDAWRAALGTALVGSLSGQQPVGAQHLAKPEQDALDALSLVVESASGMDAGDPGIVHAALVDGARMLEQRGHAPLRLGTVGLCSSVRGFGRYEVLESDRFLHGSGVAAVLYAEIDGFTQDRTGSEDDPSYHVALSRHLSITPVHDTSLVVWERDWRAVNDTSRSHRNDFFIVERVELPPTLSVGRYLLKVAVRDDGRDDGALAEVVVPFRVVGDPAIARAPGGRPVVRPSHNNIQIGLGQKP